MCKKMNKGAHSALPKHTYISTDKMESVKDKRHCLVFKTVEDKFWLKVFLLLYNLCDPLTHQPRQGYALEVIKRGKKKYITSAKKITLFYLV